MKIVRKILRSPWFWLLLISFLPLLPLFHAGVPITHDGRIHLARLANFYASLAEGNSVPRWASNLNWGYGTPILEFVYPLPSYIASLFHALRLSIADSMKLVFGLSYIASIFAMYLWMREEWGEKAAVIGAVLYGFAPYRLVDLYVRGALGEHMAFLFPPLICYFVSRFKKHDYNILGLSLSTAGLILSHNALALIFLPVLFLYSAYVAGTNTKHWKTLLFNLSVSFGFGFLLSAFFWIPALLEAKYTLQDRLTQNVIQGNFVPFTWFFYSPWNYGGSLQFTKSVGVFHWIGIGVLLIVLTKLKKYTKVLSIIFFVIFAVSLFMMTEQSNIIWSGIPLLQKFQFPWRLLSLTTFLSSVLGGIVLSIRAPKHGIVMIFIIAAIIVASMGMWKPNGYIVEPETTYTGVFDSTTDSGELSPKWSVRFMEFRPEHKIEVIGGSATIEEGMRNTTTRNYIVKGSSRAQLVENTLYFPGWDVYVDGKTVPIEFQDPNNRGLITFFVPEGMHSVRIQFTDTKVRRIANWISVLSIIILVIWKRKK